MSKPILIIAAFTICTAIILGAMAAHGLESILSADLIESFEKGVRYQFYAGFSLLILGAIKDKFVFSLRWFTWLTIAGVKLFSGCIYLYCFHEQVPVLKPLVYLVPIGGLLMILAWVVFMIQLIRFQK
ncbi:MAG: DUF423 domain-containing protein [Crocinitomicaceae bacterium]|jgi:uncharacterized membrane protein YgdD (TMEM256/DUF423 family)|nr:DUF423 domain-containing protein [Crocinitomicaceae bacterium]MBK6951781.1 DUF423 domain-containing protein [Crocinitomicaceae bacterium]